MLMEMPKRKDYWMNLKVRSVLNCTLPITFSGDVWVRTRRRQIVLDWKTQVCVQVCARVCVSHAFLSS